MLELLASEYRIYAQDALALTICGCALVWGGGPERAVAATWLIVFQLGLLVYEEFVSLGYQLLGIDLWLASSDWLAGLIWIAVALYANRNYTLAIAGLQLLAMIAHLARGLTDLISPVSYVVMYAAPGWFQLMFLAIGLVRHIQRKRRYGTYRDWRVTKPASGSVVNRLGARSQSDWLSRGGASSWRDDLK